MLSEPLRRDLQAPLTRSGAGTLLGSQVPRVWATPAYGSTAGPECVELCRRSGVLLDPWQQFVLDGALGIDDSGQWAATEVGLVVPRQNGKGEVLLARALAGLFLFNERLIVHTAHLVKTALDAFRRIKEVIKGSYELRRRVDKVSESNGKEGITLKSGQELRFFARSEGSGRGFTGDTIILDEAYALDERHVAALAPVLATAANPQVWYASSAGMSDSAELHRVRRRGIALAALEGRQA